MSFGALETHPITTGSISHCQTHDGLSIYDRDRRDAGHESESEEETDRAHSFTSARNQTRRSLTFRSTAGGHASLTLIEAFEKRSQFNELGVREIRMSAESEEISLDDRPGRSDLFGP